MLLGIFGLPGGAELIVIAGVVLVLFVPSLLFFGLGYMMGRKSGAHTDPGAQACPQVPNEGAGADHASADDAAAGDGTGSGDGSDA